MIDREQAAQSFVQATGMQREDAEIIADIMIACGESGALGIVKIVKRLPDDKALRVIEVLEEFNKISTHALCRLERRKEKLKWKRIGESLQRLSLTGAGSGNTNA